MGDRAALPPDLLQPLRHEPARGLAPRRRSRARRSPRSSCRSASSSARPRDLEREGQIAAPYYVELHKRFALPVAALVFALVGFPLGIRSHRGGRAVALALSFGIVVSYYILYTSIEGMALRGRLPAALAVWLPNAALRRWSGVALLRGSVAGVPPAWLDLFWRLWAKIGERRSGRVGQAARGAPRGAGSGGSRGPRASTFIIDRYLIRAVPDLPRHRHRRRRGAHRGGGPAPDPRPLPAGQAALHPRSSSTSLYRLPGELYKGLPMIVLIATVFLFLSLTRQRELDALKAAGISLYRASLPILLVAGAHQRRRRSSSRRRRCPTSTPRPRRWTASRSAASSRGTCSARPRSGTAPPTRASSAWRCSTRSASRMEGLTVLEISRDFRLRGAARRRAARSGRPRAGSSATACSGGSAPQNRVTSEPFDSRLVAMPEHIDDFIQVQNAPETMSFLELRAYVAKLREGGHQVGKYLVQLYSKLSFPLVHVIMALVAIPFALVVPAQRRARRGHRGGHRDRGGLLDGALGGAGLRPGRPAARRCSPPGPPTSSSPGIGAALFLSART